MVGGQGQGFGGGSVAPLEQAAFFFCDILAPMPKSDMGKIKHPVFSLATRLHHRGLEYHNNGVDVTVIPSVKGQATIFDKHILIYCASQLVAALNAGRAVSRTLQLTAHDLLTATHSGTSGDGYRRLCEAFKELAGTRITTNLATGGVQVTQGLVDCSAHPQGAHDLGLRDALGMALSCGDKPIFAQPQPRLFSHAKTFGAAR